MKKRTNADQLTISCCPKALEGFANEESLWHESEEAIATGLVWGGERPRLLKWVRRQMRRRLTAKQRRCIELHYFKNLSFMEVGKRMGCGPSSACRSAQRGIRRLRALTKTDPPEHMKPRRRRLTGKPQAR